MDIGGIWDLIALQPVMNVLIVLTNALFGNFGLAIIAITLVVNACMLPLTLKQSHSSKAMQAMQPKMAELQKKYAKDKQKLAQEQMKLYKESGVSPAGCLLPMLIQMPVWIALYQSIMRVMAVIPENLAGLSPFLYSWDVVYSALPLNSHFLWLNLASGDMVLALLVGASMWVQQKMVQAPVTDPSQKTQSSIMLWMMPIMFAWLSMSFPSGLALYWFTSNLFRIGVQYFVGGWGGLIKDSGKKQPVRDKKYRQRIAAAEKGATDITPSSTQEEDSSYGESGDKRPDGGRGYTKSLRDVKPRSRRSRGNRPKRG